MRVHAFAAKERRGRLASWEYELDALGPLEVDIDVACCGVCHSDVHLLDDDWKKTRYPFVPGHEIVGHVARVGAAVTGVAVGQRVGVGWQCGACFACEQCIAGAENLCGALVATCVGRHGGFADRVRVDARFAFPLPDGIESASAAPLLCGGVTVYAPLHRLGVDATRRVGVIGIGGLGHLAILFARALGAEVVAFSSSPDKRDDALRMGAVALVDSRDPRALRGAFESIDVLVSTVAARLDWTSFLRVLRPNGVLCFVGAPPGVLSIPASILLEGQRSICGSEIGGRRDVAEMLAFAARAHVAPIVERFPMHAADVALDRLRSNGVRYRAVLENA